MEIQKKIEETVCFLKNAFIDFEYINFQVCVETYIEFCLCRKSNEKEVVEIYFDSLDELKECYYEKYQYIDNISKIYKRVINGIVWLDRYEIDSNKSPIDKMIFHEQLEDSIAKSKILIGESIKFHDSIYYGIDDNAKYSGFINFSIVLDTFDIIS